MGTPVSTTEAMKCLLLLFPLLCLSSAKPEGGLFGWGLLGGDPTTAPAPATTAAPESDPGIEDLLFSLLAGGSSSAETPDIPGIMNVLTGQSDTLPIEKIAGLFGITADPIPSPVSEPIKFLTHPLITPLILAGVTMNPPAIALAMGNLAGSLALTHILTMQAAEAAVTTVATLTT